MDYEKAYKQALARAREIHRNEDKKRRDMEWLFPELKELNDERIRKELIENFKWFCGDFPETTKWGKDDNLLVKDIIAWLEKQGKFDDNIITRDDEILQAISVGLTDVFVDIGWSDFGGLPIEEIQKWLEKQGEQKPIWTDNV